MDRFGGRYGGRYDADDRFDSHYFTPVATIIRQLTSNFDTYDRIIASANERRRYHPLQPYRINDIYSNGRARIEVIRNRHGSGMAATTASQYTMPRRQTNGRNRNDNGWPTVRIWPTAVNDTMHHGQRPVSNRNSQAQNIHQNGQSAHESNDPPSNDPPSNDGPANPLYMECVICFENIDSQNISSTPCGHLFCTSCITRAVQNSGACPLCNKAFRLSALRRVYLPVRNPRTSV